MSTADVVVTEVRKSSGELSHTVICLAEPSHGGGKGPMVCRAPAGQDALKKALLELEGACVTELCVVRRECVGAIAS